MVRRQRCSRTLVLTLIVAVTYILVCNIFTLYHLSRTKPNSIVHQYGQFYLGHLNTFRNWTCKPVKLSEVDLPLTALASYPGSGNTWLRHLLQQATGISTGSEYVDISLKLHGFPSEGIKNASVLAIKTHGYDDLTLHRYDRAILLIREPKETLIAEFNRRHGGHHGYAQKADFRKEWHMFVIEETANWYQFNKKWLSFPKSLHIVLYKQLKQNTSHELTQLLKFLNVSISRKELLCVIRNIKGHFKRPGINGQINDPTLFTNSMQRTMDTYWDELKTAVKERNNKSS